MVADLNDPTVKQSRAAELRKKQRAGELRAKAAPPPSPEPTTTEEAGPGAIKAGAIGLASGVTAGFLPRIHGAVQAVADFVKGNVGFSDFTDAYDFHVESARRQVAEAEEASPVAFGAGQLGGALVPGSALLKSAKIAGMGARGVAAAGAIEGGAFAAGETEDLTSLEAVGDIAGGAALGGVIGAGGAALSTAGEAVQAAGGSTARSVMQKFGFPRKAFKAAKGASKTPEKAIENLMDRGIIPRDPLAMQKLSAEEMESLLVQERGKLGAGIRTIVERVDDLGVDIDPNILGRKSITDAIKTIRLNPTAVQEVGAAIDNVEGVLNRQFNKAQDLWDMRRELDTAIGKLSRGDFIGDKKFSALTDARNRISAKLEQVVSQHSDDPTVQRFLDGATNFKQLNGNYGDTAILSDLAADSAAAERKAARTFGQSLRKELSSGTVGTGVATGAAIGATTAGPAGALAGGLIGAASQAAIKSGALETGVVAAGQAARKSTAGALKAAGAVLSRDAAIAQQLYPSFNPETSTLSDPQDVQTHAADVLGNPMISHAQKFREINLVQTTGRVNPTSINPAKRARVQQEIQRTEETLDEEIMGDVLRQLKGL